MLRSALFALAMLSTPALSAEIDAQIAAERATLAASHLAFSESPQGGFFYEYDFAAGLFSAGDNIVRQAGAGSALAEYLARTGDLEHAPRMAQVLGFYEAMSVPFEDGLVVSDTGDLGGGNTGATALALLAELFYVEATGDTRFAATRESWLRALSSLQNSGGGFARSPGTEEESPYYNGEAWLALAHASRIFPDEPLIEGLLQGADASMLARYQANPETGFVHWGLQTAAIRYEETGEPRFAEFLIEVSNAFISEMRPGTNQNSNSCSMVEGIAASAHALAARGTDPDLVERLIARSTVEMAKNIELQIVEGQLRLELGENRFFQDAMLPLFAGAFLNGRHDLRSRIDYTQHCLSALLKYEALLAQRP